MTGYYCNVENGEIVFINTEEKYLEVYHYGYVKETLRNDYELNWLIEEIEKGKVLRLPDCEFVRFLFKQSKKRKD